MNISYIAEDFSRGTRVNVEPLPDDFFSHPFTGYVVGYKKGSLGEGTLVQVRDLDDDTWDCCPEQLSYNTDELMHADSCGHIPEK